MSSTLFRKKCIRSSIVLILIVFFNANLAWADCDLDKFSEMLFSNVQHRGLVDKSSTDYFSKQEKDIAMLASINSNRSNRYLAKLSIFYLGESVNEVVAEAITKKRKAIIPFLEAALKEQPVCQQGVKICSSQTTALLDLIKQEKTFQPEEKSLKPYSRDELCQEMGKTRK